MDTTAKIAKLMEKRTALLAKLREVEEQITRLQATPAAG